MLGLVFVLLLAGGAYFLTTVGYSVSVSLLVSVAICFAVPFLWGLVGSLFPQHVWRILRNAGSVVFIFLAFAVIGSL